MPVINARKHRIVTLRTDWIILFVVTGSVNVVYAKIIAVKTVTVSQDTIVSVKLILQNVNIVSRIHAGNYFRLGGLRYYRLLGRTCDPANDDDDDDYHHGVARTRYYG